MSSRHLSFVCALAAFAIASLPADGQLVITARDTSNFPLRLLPTPGEGLPTPEQVEINLPAGARAVGLTTYPPHFALVGDWIADRILIVNLATGGTVDTIPIPGFEGEGTIAVTPNHGWALAASGTQSEPTTLYVIKAPFGASSEVGTVALPGFLGGWQARGIAFDPNGRAFVYHSEGISVLDPPYASITFEILLPDNEFSGAITITPDGQTLLVTKMRTAYRYVGILRAPFSPASTQEILNIPQGNRLDGIVVARDGSFALVVSYNQPQLFAIAAPFTVGSVVEEIPMPAGFGGSGFEYVELDANGQLAVLTGGSGPSIVEPYAFVQAPFTAAGASVHLVAPLGGLDRGGGSASFLNVQIFTDGFESGDTSRWSRAVP
jgi:hypothetical protein